MSIKIKNLFFQYNQYQKSILNNINIDIKDDETVALLGISGSGKSTLFNVITSLYNPTSGEVHFGNSQLYDLAYIRQSAMDMLFPWKTVQGNIEFALIERRNLTSENKKRINLLLTTLRLNHRKNYYPKELSGGELKRLSFACGLSYSPKIILLDEAFTGIDLSLKLELWTFLRSEMAKTKTTSFLITHDFDEAIYLADRIIFIGNNGALHAKEILIGKTLKENNSNIESFFSNHLIVEIKKEALMIFRSINTNE